MNGASAHYARTKALFLAALQHPAAERDGYLQAACGEDRELLAEMRELLSNAEATAGLAREIGVDGSVVPQVAGYRVLREIGRGGMGVVYLAERDVGGSTLRVALKLLSLDAMSDADRQARFRSERRILAALEHPNIARLLDGGNAADGRPFLAMEYVEGERLDRWCHSRELGLTARLGLFLKICRAVQSAHQRLIVHRDLKPANILVDAQGEPKLLDFGIAKLLDPGASGEQALTGTGLQLLTPSYAAPEQIRGELVTTATDVYALGVILYESLTGMSPYGRDTSQTPDLLRAVCDIDPSKPSSMLSDGKAAQQPGLVAAQLRGDLDAIVLKCLRKEADQRYAGAAALADDLENFLAQRPVQARHGGSAYALGKFLRRYRVAVAAAALVFLTLIGAAVLMSLQLAETRLERERALSERNRAEQVSRFLLDLFREADPRRALGAQVTVREAVTRGGDKLQAQLADQPLIRSALLTELANIEQILGDRDRAQRLAERAVADLEPRVTQEPLAYARALGRLASVLQDQGEYDSAVTHYQTAQRLSASLDAVEYADYVNREATLELERGEANRAKQLRERSLAELLRAVDRPDLAAAAARPDRGNAWELLAIVAQNQCVAHYEDGAYREALASGEQALAIKRHLYPPDHPTHASTLDSMANVYAVQGDYAQANALRRDVLALNEKVFGPDHISVGIAALNLGSDLRPQGDLDGAEAMDRRAVAILTARKSAEHPYTLIAMANLADVIIDRGRLDEALRMHREILAVRRRTLAADDLDIVDSLASVARVEWRLDQRQVAVETQREAVAVAEIGGGKDHPQATEQRLNLAVYLLETDAVAEAQSLAQAAKIYWAERSENIADQVLADFVTAQALWRNAETRPAAIDLARQALTSANKLNPPVRVEAKEIEAWLKDHPAGL